MITTLLSRIENYNGFLGTFDQGATWWRSEPIAGAAEILSFAWIYGEYHVCAVRKTNGTYSIFQSYNHGYSWREQLNTVEKIYLVYQPDYGVAIAATDSGWWKSENSGTDWSKISAQAPGCHTVEQLTNNRLVALDGTYVYYSDDCAATWTKSKKKGTSTDLIAKTLYPTVAGTYNDVFLGCTSSNAGGTGTDVLLYSDDGGASFQVWRNEYGYADGWTGRETGRNLNNDVITDIELAYTTVDGTSEYIPWFLIQVLMPSGYCRHWLAEREVWSSYHKLACTIKFDSYATPGKSLETSQILETGTADIERIAFFSGMSSSGEPLIKVSDDGGHTWTDINPADTVVYSDPEGTGTSPNPFQDDVYTTASWFHSICHNGFNVIETRREQCQSYDMDFRILPWRSETETYQGSAYVEGTDTATYKAAPHRIEAVGTKDYDADSIIAVDHTSTYDADAIAEARRIAVYRMNRHLEGGSDTTYQMGALVYSSNFPQINMPQAYRLEFPWIAESGYPYDSREA